MSIALSYRRDIDGLRALAVIPVVLYHLGGTAFTGGYVGVDIFFVISGYLITSIILREQAAGLFSLAAFYERRVRRILPALFVMLGASAIAGFVFLFPPDLAYFGRATAATAAFGSNLLFWRESGYFEPAALTVPLLHTWSLAVEEQFYIFFPVFLILTQRYFRRAAVPLVVAGAALSFALCLVAMHGQSYAAMFYLLPTRAWELLVGAALAFGIARPPQGPRMAAALCAAGIGLIAYAMLSFDNDTVFPGPAALYPVLGAALIILAGGRDNAASRLVLGNRPAVFFGKISYSLYLWHWPLLVFLQYRFAVEESLTLTAALFAVSTLLATLSWKFVEQPVRARHSFSRKALFSAAFALSLLFIAGGLFLSAREGFPDRFPAHIRALYEVGIGTDLPPIADKPADVRYNGMLGDANARPSFLLWGDSHADAASPGIDIAARKMRLRGYFMGRQACVPSYTDVAIAEDGCNKSNRAIVAWLRNHPEVETVYLVGHWSRHEKYYAEKSHGRPPALRDTLDALMTGLEQDNKKIVLMIDMPHAPVYNVPLYVARAEYYGTPITVRYDLKDHTARQAPMTAIYNDLRRTHDFRVYDPVPFFCPDGICPMRVDGRPTMQGDNHLSTHASRTLSGMYLPLFQ